jgi:hypothetical protein
VLLIVTNREDFAADFMIAHLLERGLPYYRLNADEIPATRVTVHIDSTTTHRQLTTGAATVALEDVRCVWYRRAVRPPLPNEVASEFGNFAAAELRDLYEGIITDPQICWVNPMDATEISERKLYQLRTATAAGLFVPPTVVSNDPEVLRSFVASHDRVICKPVSQGLVNSGTSWFAVHTREVIPADLDETSGLETVPTLLQRLVPRGTDIRLTIIGDAIFPVEVLVPPGAPVDWRAAHGALCYRECDIPADVEQACRTLMSTLGIVYGAFDFIRTDDGQWVFLEVNPAGEWAWLEVELGLPMRKAFTTLFYG